MLQLKYVTKLRIIETQTSAELLDLKDLIYNNFDPSNHFDPSNQCTSNNTYGDNSSVCGGTGWRRVAYLDMSDPRATCPYGWNMTNYNNTRTCGRISEGSSACDSVFFPVFGHAYSQVCGIIKAYQWGATTGFYLNRYYYYHHATVNDAYFSGVAVMPWPSSATHLVICSWIS